MEIIDDRDYGAFIPSDLDDFGLDIYEFRIYAHLSRRVGRRGECFEGVSKIAAICRIDKKTVTQKLKSLQSSRLINLQPRSGRTNSITLTHQSEWGPARAVEPDPLTGQPATGSTRQRIDTRSVSGSTGQPVSGSTPDPSADHKGIPFKVLPVEGTPTKGKKKGCSSKKKAVDVYAELIDRSRFEKVWAWHRDNICSIAGAEAGDKVAAAWAWKELEESNFYGKGIEGFKKGCALFKAKAIATHGVGIQHVSRFLTGPVKGEPRWLTYLNESEAPQVVGDFLDGVDTGATREAIGAELTRLGISGLLPQNWAQQTGCATVSDLSTGQAAEYLTWLKQQEATHAA